MTFLQSQEILGYVFHRLLTQFLEINLVWSLMPLIFLAFLPYLPLTIDTFLISPYDAPNLLPIFPLLQLQSPFISNILLLKLPALIKHRVHHVFPNRVNPLRLSACICLCL